MTKAKNKIIIGYYEEKKWMTRFISQSLRIVSNASI